MIEKSLKQRSQLGGSIFNIDFDADGELFVGCAPAEI